MNSHSRLRRHRPLHGEGFQGGDRRARQVVEAQPGERPGLPLHGLQLSEHERQGERLQVLQAGAEVRSEERRRLEEHEGDRLPVSR